MYAHTTLGQDGFYCRGLWGRYLLASLPFDLRGTALPMCSQGGGLLTSRRRNTWSGQGQAPLNCPAVNVLDFWSIKHESPTTLSWGAISLPPHQCCPHGLWLGKELSQNWRGRHGTLRRGAETPPKGFLRRQLAD